MPKPRRHRDRQLHRGQRDAKDTLAVVPWFWVDWRASKARAALRGVARDAYRELLDAHWGEVDCALEDDDKMLASLVGISIDEWLAVKDQVLRFLPLNRAGKRQNPRAFHEWKKSRRLRVSNRKKAAEAANYRWKKEKEKKTGPSSINARSMRHASVKHERKPKHSMLKHALLHTTRTPTPSPTPTPLLHQDVGRAASGVAPRGVEGGNGQPPPPAASAPWSGPGPIPHDPNDLVQSQLVARCYELAAKEHGREPTDQEIREVLTAVSTTSREGKSLTDLRGASPAWVVQSLRDCERFEEDLLEADQPP